MYLLSIHPWRIEYRFEIKGELARSFICITTTKHSITIEMCNPKQHSWAWTYVYHHGVFESLFQEEKKYYSTSQMEEMISDFLPLPYKYRLPVWGKRRIAFILKKFFK